MERQVDHLEDHTIICGAGTTGIHVIEEHVRTGHPFVVIERDRRNYEEAVRRGYLAIEGVASDEEVLLRAGLARAGHVETLGERLRAWLFPHPIAQLFDRARAAAGESGLRLARTEPEMRTEGREVADRRPKTAARRARRLRNSARLL